MTEKFVQEMETQFGSDEALGVYFITDDGQERLSLAQFNELAAQYDNPGDMPGMQSYLADGGSAVCCTDYAATIYRQLERGRVQIFGFANEDNPTSRCAREEYHPGGHDFAVVDQRFIVDPWPRLVAGVFDQMVFDLEDPTEGQLALDIYGPRSCWKWMSAAERHAEETRHCGV